MSILVPTSPKVGKLVIEGYAADSYEWVPTGDTNAAKFRVLNAAHVEPIFQAVKEAFKIGADDECITVRLFYCGA